MNAACPDFFNDLWHKNNEKLHNYAYHALHNESLEAEAVQETFLTAVRNLDKLKTHPNQGGWLMSTLKNIILRTITAEIRQRVCVLQPNEDMGLTEILPASTSPWDRTLLVRYYECGYSLGEIAVQLQITVNKCKMDLYYARRRVKCALLDEMGGRIE